MKKIKAIFVSSMVCIMLIINILPVLSYAKENNENIIEENIVESDLNLSNDPNDIEENLEKELDEELVKVDENNSEVLEESTTNNSEITTEEKEENKIIESDSNIIEKNDVLKAEKEEILDESKNTEEKINDEVSNTVVKNQLENSNVSNSNEENNNSISSKNEENVASNVNKNEVIKNTKKESTNTANTLKKENVDDIQVTNFQNAVSPSVTYSTHVQNRGWISNKKDGERAGTTGSSLRLEALKIKLSGLDNVNISYRVHVQNIGWQGWKHNGELAGTEGKALRLEGIKIRLESTDDYSVMYRVHIQNIGWQDWRTDGDFAGTEGKSLRLEAIEIKIVPKVKKGIIKIEKPISAQKVYSKTSFMVSGWKMSNLSNTKMKAFVDNKEVTDISYIKRNDIITSVDGYGTLKENPLPGYSFLVDASKMNNGNHTVKVVLYAENNSVLKQETVTFFVDTNIHIAYNSHVQNIGWQSYKMDGELSGTEGKAYRVEALKIKLYNAPENAKIKYRTHVQNIGWQNWKSNDELSGTEGKALRIEAIQLKLENLKDYTVEYQVHIQNKGWSGWLIDGETAGTVGEALRIEAIRIRVVPKYKRRYLGIDVSRYNGNIDWTAVKNSGVDYAMIRVGFRGYAEEGNLALDPKFVQNIEGAKKAGVKVGIYFFTQAINEQEAVQEANWVIEKIKPYKIDMPVAIDVEFSSESHQQGRADSLDRATRTAVTRKFCEVIQNTGYIPMIYLNVDWAKNYVNMSDLKDFDVWIAHYKNNPDLSPNYSGSYTMWQYTSSGHINGISGDVDCNICYKNY